QIDYGFGLRQIHFPMEECAFGKFTRPRSAGAGLKTTLQHSRGDQDATVASDLHQVFTSVTGRCAMHRQHHLVHQTVLIMNLTEMLNVRRKGRWSLATAED